MSRGVLRLAGLAVQRQELARCNLMRNTDVVPTRSSTSNMRAVLLIFCLIGKLNQVTVTANILLLTLICFETAPGPPL
jgi:hypothetical protein